tara:strand:+ start:1253 stop:2488 length:1236 start_codon:yes stop_codon:yes gene_type:complete
MRNLFTVFTLFFLTSCATNISSVTIPDIQETQSDITIEDFQTHIEFLSSDELQGRGAGTEGDKIAVSYIKQRFYDAAPNKAKIEVQEHYVFKDRRQKKDKVLTYNVIGYLVGNDKKLKDEFVVIGGHYDTTANPPGKINNGADDNASGTSMVIELFEKFAATNNHKRTLVFMAFGGEELGLLGSKHFVNNPTIDLDNVQLMVNLDMIGRMEDNNVQLGGSATAENFSSLLHPFLMEDNVNVIELGEGIFSRSDHYNFYKKDIPTLFFFTGVHDDYHKPSDDAHKINYNGMKSISNMVEGIVEEFANTPDRLIFKSVEQKQTMSQPARMKVTLGIMPDYAFDKNGVRADSVIDNRPGQKAGMIEGDIVIKIKDMDILDIYKYMEALSKIEPGTKTQMTVLRDKEEIVLDVQF